MDQKTINQSLRAYLDRLGKSIYIDEALLFGSSISGSRKEDSDVDLLILSRDFSKYDFDTRLKIIYRASTGFPYDLHAYGVTPEEYATASHLTILGAIRSANPVAVKK